MFKVHSKQQLSGSIHSGHFMVSRLDDDEDENNDVGDDTSESERDNAQSVEIDVNNPESVADAAKNLDIAYRVDSPSSKNELVTNWNDLDRPAKRIQKQHQYLTYYTNTSSNYAPLEEDAAGGAVGVGTLAANSAVDPDDESAVPVDARISRAAGDEAHGRGSIMGGRYSAANLSASSSASSSAAGGLAAAASVSDGAASAVVSAGAGATAAATSAPTAISSATSITSYMGLERSAKRLCTSRGPDTGQKPAASQQNQPAALQSTQACGHAHAVTIDTSLTKLLECMSLYYSSKLTSPKWKSFKGLKLRLKYKIRLNNLIWRAWFLQCIRGRRPPGCQFTAPAESEVHKKSETIVLEGKYWKRKEKAIVDEYKKWRIFHSKQKSQHHCFRPVSSASSPARSPSNAAGQAGPSV